METLLESCGGGLKWHWHSIMGDLREAGLESVVIEPIPLGQNCFSGICKGKIFTHSWVKNNFLLVSMKEDDYSSQELAELVDAFSKVVEYRPFCKYRFMEQATVEWDKNDPEGRRKQLEAEGKKLELI